MGRFSVRTWWVVVIAAIAVATAGALGWAGWRTSRVLRQSAQEVRSEHQLRFTLRPFVPVSASNFEAVSSPEVFLQAARFQGHLYIAGPAALAEYDLNGKLLREFNAGRELPSSALVALAVGTSSASPEPELVLATATEGVLLFDGQAFRQIYPADDEAREITAILPLHAGHLLIGTKKRGVLLYDGKEIRELHPTLSHFYVQALSGNELDLWVGTLSNGLRHWHAGTTETFGTEQGLPDRQVQAIAVAGEQTYIGTPLGIAEFDRGRFSRALGEGLLVTALFVSGGELLVGTEDQGVVRIPRDHPHANHLAQRNGGDSVNFNEVRQFLESGNSVYVLTRGGMFDLTVQGFAAKEVLQPRPALLSDRNISALAADADGQLWIGYFDRGVDLLPGNASVVHVENQHVFCINRIWPDVKSGTVLLATANGLVRMSPAGVQKQVLTRADGLIADHVTDVAQYRGGLAIATPAGLTFLNGDGARSLYAFHGLVNNHVYALGVSGDDLLVGTLGGISAIAKGEIRSNYTAGASGLKQNWVTAVVPVGDEWMVGTYGSGVMSMDRAGTFHALDQATAAMEINPNAMLATARHVFAGTLGHGLYVYDREKARWSVLRGGLPSENVTALGLSKGFIYVGTDNGLVRIPEEKLQP